MERKKIPFSDNFYIDTDANVFDIYGNKRIRQLSGWVALYASAENAELLKSYISDPAEI